MDTKVSSVLKKVLALLVEHKTMHQTDGYLALAQDVADMEMEVRQLLNQSFSPRYLTPDGEAVRLAKGLDGKTYLVFLDSGESSAFLDRLGAKHAVLYHFGQYENAVQIDGDKADWMQPADINRKIDREVSKVNTLSQAERWLRACSSWMLTNDLDTTLPDGILDTDPLEIAESLEKLRSII